MSRSESCHLRENINSRHLLEYWLFDLLLYRITCDTDHSIIYLINNIYLNIQISHIIFIFMHHFHFTLSCTSYVYAGIIISALWKPHGAFYILVYYNRNTLKYGSRT